MVPKGWEKTTFGEHIDLLNGFAFKSALYSDDENDIKLLRGDNIEPNKLRWRDVKRWSKNEYESLEKYHLKANDFIIAMDRTWITAGLKVAEVKQEDLPCLLVQRVSRMRSLSTLCQDLIKHHFSSYQFEQYVKSVQTETAVPHISATQIREFGLLLPPLPEQQKIAKILSTWDKAISTTERLIENSTQQKKAVMQQLLTGKKRLLDESGQRFEGKWEVLTIGDVVELFNGYAFKSSDALEKGYKWLKIANVGIGEIKWDNSSYLPEGYEDEYNRFNLKVGDVVVAMTRPTLGNKLKIARLKNKADESLLNQRVAKLLFSEKVSSEYMYQLLSTIEVALKLNHALLGTDPPNLSTKVLHEISMELPPLIEQQKIATVLTNADKEIELLEQQLADLQQEKKALMQVLLTGKIRVVVGGEDV